MNKVLIMSEQDSAEYIAYREKEAAALERLRKAIAENDQAMRDAYEIILDCAEGQCDDPDIAERAQDFCATWGI